MSSVDVPIDSFCPAADAGNAFILAPIEADDPAGDPRAPSPPVPDGNCPCKLPESGTPIPDENCPPLEAPESFEMAVGADPPPLSAGAPNSSVKTIDASRLELSLATTTTSIAALCPSGGVPLNKPVT